ncbi:MULTISPECIES: DapH/DapD/GlmU-related protein [Tenacibaculum]|uniref:DapH/DapD/GlmU-related protein n=1 Tax=Tenacibaculum TaxID=104267 RepID=UPI0026E445A1|nr:MULTISPECIES: DapH/DapD/GlmU-related protein [Tenacibaculum]MDO6600868.1 DapH/DapD/GlmU-related protein [Tenacibaculum sp. 1_MG-2023]
MSWKINLIKKIFSKKISARIIFLGPKRFVQYFIAQKIFRINSNVPWPVHWSSTVTHPNNIKKKSQLPFLGHHFGCYIQANNGIHIGYNLRYGPNVHIVSASHDLNDYEKHTKGKPIIIGDNCWIGAGAIILPEVELGNHIIVAAGSVVTKSFKENNVLIAGIPAKIVKELESYSGKFNGIEK